MDIRNNISQPGQKYTLFPYAKDLWYRPEIETLGMTIEIYNERETLEMSFAMVVNGRLEEFLERLEEKV